MRTAMADFRQLHARGAGSMEHRAYDADGSILGGRYVEAGGPRTVEEELEDLYRDPAVAAVHVRAVEYGCFLMETRRL
jgi:hypothetical protein